MLALTRRRGERIIITLPDGRTFPIELQQINGYKAAILVFDAPSDVRIDREEIFLRRQQEAKT